MAENNCLPCHDWPYWCSVSLAAYLEQKSPWKAGAYSHRADDSQTGYYRKREGSEEGHTGKHMQGEKILIFETGRRSTSTTSMWCEGELEDLVGREADLGVLRGEVRTHAHAESAVRRVGRGATNRADGVWEGRGKGIVRITRRNGPHIRSGGKEVLIPRVRDGISEGVIRNNLGHCKGEEVML